MNIIMAGVGGVGGFYGGLLAQSIQTKKLNHKIYFYSREKTAKKIQGEGLILEVSGTKHLIKPTLASHQLADFETPDLVILSVKSYQLEEVLNQLKQIVHKNTAFLPLLNGIQSEEIIANYFPTNEIWNGFVFVFSKKISANHIAETGTQNYFQFGWNKPQSQKQTEFEELLKAANINGGFNSQIRISQWEKFYFISTLSAITTYKNIQLGEVINNPENLLLYKNLVTEFREYANERLVYENIDFAFQEDYLEVLLHKIKQSNPKSTTSMQRDFYEHGISEIDNLIGSVANYSTHFVYYQKVYSELKNNEK